MKDMSQPNAKSRDGLCFVVLAMVSCKTTIVVLFFVHVQQKSQPHMGIPFCRFLAAEQLVQRSPQLQQNILLDIYWDLL